MSTHVMTRAIFTLQLSAWILFSGCTSRHPTPIRIEGQTMGTTYHVTYFDDQQRNFKNGIDSLLVLVNKSINNYDTSSTVSSFNRSIRGIADTSPYFLVPLKKGLQVSRESSGSFDMTVMPLVNAWGFGPKKGNVPDSMDIDSIRQFVGYQNVLLKTDSVVKKDPRVQIDFGGIGQGYGADVITAFLKSKGIEHMLVELGGEGMAIGMNKETDKPWQIGILHPYSTYTNQYFLAYASLTDRSFTTSGNYFNYREIDGVRVSHTIDPFTGYPVNRKILSASVFGADATLVDAWATAFMVMGHEQAIETLQQHREIEAFLTYSDEKGELKTFSTPGLNGILTVEKEGTNP